MKENEILILKTSLQSTNKKIANEAEIKQQLQQQLSENENKFKDLQQENTRLVNKNEYNIKQLALKSREMSVLKEFLNRKIGNSDKAATNTPVTEIANICKRNVENAIDNNTTDLKIKHLQYQMEKEIENNTKLLLDNKKLQSQIQQSAKATSCPQCREENPTSHKIFLILNDDPEVPQSVPSIDIVEVLKARLDSSLDKIHLLEVQLCEDESNFLQMQQQYSLEQEMRIKLQREIDQVAITEEHFLQMHSLYSESEDRAKILQEEILHLTAENERKSEDIKIKEKEISFLKTSLQSAVKKIAKEVQIKQQLQQQLSENENKIKDLQQENTRLVNKNEYNIKELALKSREISVLKEFLNRKIGNCDKAATSTPVPEIANICKCNVENAIDNNTTDLKVKNLQYQLEKEIENNTKLLLDNKKLQSKIQQCAKATCCPQCREENPTSHKIFLILNDDPVVPPSVHSIDLVEELQAKLESSLEKIHELDEQLRENESNFLQMQKQYSVEQRMREKFQQEIDEVAITDEYFLQLHSLYSESEDQVKKLQEKILHLTNENQRQSEKIRIKNNKIVTLKKSVQSTDRKIANEGEIIQKLRQQLSEHENKVKALQQENNRLVNKNEYNTKELALKSREMSVLKEFLDRRVKNSGNAAANTAVRKKLCKCNVEPAVENNTTDQKVKHLQCELKKEIENNTKLLLDKKKLKRRIKQMEKNFDHSQILCSNTSIGK
ncbi:golgin subfamily A member 4-like [Musca vetustissima]|uniref:golgin subfamily A member 4-like n=1 Tax=Musca vetustissima TaxID=27455 RepID=UPI002AB7CFDD|nr:golgin subfamily A member 4-like [Musca vetustissima]